MNRTRLPTLAIVALTIAMACSQDVASTTAPDEGLVLAGKGNGKGGGGGSNDPVTIEMTGGFEAAGQQVSIVSDNKKRTELGAGFSTTVPAIEYAFAFSDKIGACSFDPTDMSAADKQNLLDHLDDGLRSRTFSAVVEKDGSPKTRIGALYDDDTGQRYKIELRDASPVQGPTDHYVVTGGTVWTVKNGQFLFCEFTGAQQLTVTR